MVEAGAKEDEEAAVATPTKAPRKENQEVGGGATGATDLDVVLALLTRRQQPSRNEKKKRLKLLLKQSRNVLQKLSVDKSFKQIMNHQSKVPSHHLNLLHPLQNYMKTYEDNWIPSR